MTRINIIERELNLVLPKEYAYFINEIGFYSKYGFEVYGLLEEMNIEQIPCVIGATKLHRDCEHIHKTDIVVSFDEFYNEPILIDQDGNVLRLSDENRILLNSSFLAWFEAEKKLRQEVFEGESL